jgi:hypothetical protein
VNWFPLAEHAAVDAAVSKARAALRDARLWVLGNAVLPGSASLPKGTADLLGALDQAVTQYADLAAMLKRPDHGLQDPNIVLYWKNLGQNVDKLAAGLRGVAKVATPIAAPKEAAKAAAAEAGEVASAAVKALGGFAVDIGKWVALAAVVILAAYVVVQRAARA